MNFTKPVLIFQYRFKTRSHIQTDTSKLNYDNSKKVWV